MPDPLDDLVRRLERIEALLRQQPRPAGRAEAGPELRSPRSMVSRLDDLWVAVTEGNERVVSTIQRLRAGTAEAGIGAPAGEETSPDTAVHLRLNRIEEALAGIATQLGATDGCGGAGPAALADLGAEVRGLALRVEALAGAVEAPGRSGPDRAPARLLGGLRSHLRR